MALMAGSRSRSLRLVIQRTNNCSSGVQRGISAFAFVNAAVSGIAAREAMESVAYPRANWGSLAIACFAAERASSWRWFSYLSRESSISRRASVERVDKGRLPYSFSRAPGSTAAAGSALREAVASRGGGGGFGQAGDAHKQGKISSRKLAAERGMSMEAYKKSERAFFSLC